MKKNLSLRQISIKSRLVIALLLAGVLPVILIYLVSMRLFSEVIEKTTATAMEQTLTMINKNMVTELEKYQYLCGMICLNEEVREGLVNDNLDQKEKHDLSQKIISAIQTQIIYPAQAKNVTICNAAGEFFFSMGYDGFFDRDLAMLIADTDRQAPADSWNYVKTYRGRDILVLGRRIRKNYASENHIGYAFVSIDEKIFSKTVLAPIELEKGHNIMYMNADGTVLSSWDREIPLGVAYPNRELFEHIREQAETARRGSFIFNKEGVHVLAAFIYNHHLNQFFVSIMPMSYLNSTITRLWLTIGLIMTGLLVLIIIGGQFIYKSIAGPIREMTVFCSSIAEGNFRARIQDCGSDELSSLSGSMDTMAQDIEELMEVQKETEKEKRKIEIQMLQYQISPHFLFNTLNSLRFVASMNNDPVVSEGIHALSLLLQNTIRNTNEYIKISEEIENLKNYFAIQSIRYAGEFEVHYEIADSLLEYYCPKFILQPLAENSIVHGAASDPAITGITVKGYPDGDAIVLLIEDDGKGFELENGSLPKSSSAGIGIVNVDQRLRLHFGEAYGLHIESTPGRGTVNLIRIPQIDRESAKLREGQVEDNV